MKKLYFHIAGFTIEISLPKAERVFEKQIMIENIKKYYGNYLINPPKQIYSPDYNITILEEETPKILYQKRQKESFINFYKEINENEIICFNNISIFQFQFILMYILQKLLSIKQGFILHSSAVEFNGNVYIFLGPQGAGKSTIVNFLNGEKYKAIADDSVIIKKDPDIFYLYQTPFIEKQYWINKGIKRFNIKRIFFLRKSNTFRLQKISSNENIMQLMLKQFWIDWIPEKYLKRQLRNITEFITHFNECYYLYFGKDKNKTKQLLRSLN